MRRVRARCARSSTVLTNSIRGVRVIDAELYGPPFLYRSLIIEPTHNYSTIASRPFFDQLSGIRQRQQHETVSQQHERQQHERQQHENVTNMRQHSINKANNMKQFVVIFSIKPIEQTKLFLVTIVTTVHDLSSKPNTLP